MQAEDKMNKLSYEKCTSSIIQKAVYEALGCLKNEEIAVISIIGFGRFSTAEYIVAAANDHHFFDTVIRISIPLESEWSVRKIQMIIIEELRSNGFHLYETSEDRDEHTWDEKYAAKKISTHLNSKKFLLVLEDPPLEGIDFVAVGVPPLDLINTRKILITTRSQDLSKVMQTNRNIPLETNNEEDFLKLVNEECLRVAYSQSFHGRLSYDSIIGCLKCMYLFGTHGGLDAELFYCWFGEIFIEGGNDHQDIMVEWEKGQDLLKEFTRRDLIKLNKRGNLTYYMINDLIQRTGFIKVSTVYLASLEDKNEKFRNQKFSWISMVNCHFQRMHNSPKCPNASMLLLCDCAQLVLLPDDLFNEIESLRVLDLSGTSISSLPTSLPRLVQSLRVLNLRNCQNLKNFPTSVQDLENLEILDLSGTSIVIDHNQQIPFEHSRKICLLNLSNNPHLSFLPSLFFSNLTHLQRLDLSSTKSLTEIPSSLSHCIRLKYLILRGCSSLRTVVSHLGQLQALTLLDLSGCKALQDISSFEQFKLPNLKLLNLSSTATQMVQLMLRDYRSLETIELEGITSVEVLDLSYTKIKQFPYQFCSETTTLKRLYLLGTNCLHQVHWEKIKCPPKELLILDHCTYNSHSNISIESDCQPQETLGGAFISVSSDTDIFGPSGHISNFLQNVSRFHVTILPYYEGRGSKGSTSISFQRKEFLYTDIYSKYLSSTTTTTLTPSIHFTHFTNMRREGGHLEIRGGNSFPKHLEGVLRCTRFLLVCNNQFVESLSQFDLTNFGQVEECWIEKCHGMEIVFKSEEFPNSYALSSLTKLWVSNLAKLMTLCKGPFPWECFARLKHLSLECCPNLVNVFSSGLLEAGLLRSLEMLEIRFCGRLREVFEEGAMDDEGEGEMVKGSAPLPQLHSLYLCELPALESISGSNMYLPKLEKLGVNGCPKLNKHPLPLFDLEKIDWWNNLRWRKNQEEPDKPKK